MRPEPSAFTEQAVRNAIPQAPVCEHRARLAKVEDSDGLLNPGRGRYMMAEHMQEAAENAAGEGIIVNDKDVHGARP